jgi:transcription termination factor Rho
VSNRRPKRFFGAARNIDGGAYAQLRATEIAGQIAAHEAA